MEEHEDDDFSYLILFLDISFLRGVSLIVYFFNNYFVGSSFSLATGVSNTATFLLDTLGGASRLPNSYLVLLILFVSGLGAS
jgi:hypothetical protein